MPTRGDLNNPRLVAGLERAQRLLRAFGAVLAQCSPLPSAMPTFEDTFDAAESPFVAAESIAAERRQALREFRGAARELMAEVDADLRREGFTPPGANLDAWIKLARIIQVDPSDLTVSEIYEEALAWAERIRVKERIRNRITSHGDRRAEGESGGNAQGVAVANHSFAFRGHLDWENWGLGLDCAGRWHLFHFSRQSGQWQRHKHAAIRIPAGIPEGLAQHFASCGPRLSLPDAHAVWKAHAKGFTSMANVVRAVKKPLSRLRRAIREVVQKEGHRPAGMPVAWMRTERCWQARIKFGSALKRDKAGITFQIRD